VKDDDPWPLSSPTDIVELGVYSGRQVTVRKLLIVHEWTTFAVQSLPSNVGFVRYLRRSSDRKPKVDLGRLDRSG